MNRTDTIILLLQHWPDWLTNGTPEGRPDGQQGARILQHDHELDCPPNITSPLQELDATLTRMAKQGKQQSVSYQRQGGPNDGATYTCSLASIRWHTLHWYIPERHAMKPTQRRDRKTGKMRRVLEPTPIRHPEARHDRAQAGIQWITTNYDWPKAAQGINYLHKKDTIKGLTHITNRAA